MPKAPERHNLDMSSLPQKHRPRVTDKRANSHQRGYNRHWSRFRKSFLQSNPLCQYCLPNGVVVSASVVDHDLPHRGDPYLFWNNTYTALCSTCHSGPKQRAEASMDDDALSLWVARRKAGGR